MAESLGRGFVVKVGFDGDEAIKGMNESQSAITSYSNEVERTTSKVNEATKKSNKEQARSFKDNVDLLASLRKNALIVGAMMAGTAAFKKTLDFSNERMHMLNFANAIGVSARSMYGLEKAAQSFGAQQGEVSNQIRSLADSVANFKNFGELGNLGDLAIAGIDIDSIVNAKDATRSFYNLISQYKNLGDDQKLRVANILGLSPELMAMMAEGRGKVRSISEAFQETRTGVGGLGKETQELMQAWLMLTSVAEGYVDVIMENVIPVLTEAVKWITDLLQDPVKVFDDMVNGVTDLFSWGDRDDKKEKKVASLQREDALANDTILSPENLGIQNAKVTEKINNNFYKKEQEKQNQQKPQDLNVNLIMDGRVIDQRIVKVQNGQLLDAKDYSLTTTTY